MLSKCVKCIGDTAEREKEHGSPVESRSRKPEDSLPREKSLLLGHADGVGKEKKSGQGVGHGGFEVKDSKKEKIMQKTEPHFVVLVV